MSAGTLHAPHVPLPLGTQLATNPKYAGIGHPILQPDCALDEPASLSPLTAHRDHHQRSQVFRLPTEVLEIIFFHCTDPARNYGHDVSPSQEKPSIPTLAVVTHVCQRWRTIALKYGVLWSQISDILRGRWSSVFIERSSPSPIDVHITLPRHPLATNEAIQSQLHRTRELHVTGGHGEVKEFMLALRHKPAPMLRSLAFHRPPEGSNITFTDPYFLVIPDDLFTGVAPQLEDLTLCSNIEVRASSLIISNLRLLQIDGGLTISRLHAVLRHTPNLRNLYVYRGFYDEDVFNSLVHGLLGFPAIPTDDSPVDLQHLENLCIECEILVEAPRFIDLLRFPRSTFVSLLMPLYVPGTPREDIAFLLNSIAYHVRGDDKQGVSRIESVHYEYSVFDEDTNLVSIVGWSADPRNTLSPAFARPELSTFNRAPTFEVRYSWKYSEIHNFIMPTPLLMTSKTLPLANTRFLSLTNKTFRDVADQARDLAAFSEVEVLAIKGEQLELSSLLRALRSPLLLPSTNEGGTASIADPSGEMESTTTTKAILLPRLKALIITTPDIKSLGGRLVIDLVKLVRSRQPAIESVAFEGCDWVSAHISNMLRQYVKVTWDGNGIEERTLVPTGVSRRLRIVPEGGST